jgi:oligopeptide/dipeptide ABC transporter ATP-binding protein
VECATVEELFDHPKHPYTEGLFRAVPRLGMPDQKLAAIPGQVPNPANFPSGCKFHPRCGRSRELAAQTPEQAVQISTGGETAQVLKRCVVEESMLRELSPGHWAACHQTAEYDGAKATEPDLRHSREVVAQAIEVE